MNTTTCCSTLVTNICTTPWCISLRHFQVSAVINEAFTGCRRHFKQISTSPYRKQAAAYSAAFHHSGACRTKLTSTQDKYFVLSHCVMSGRTQSVIWPLEAQPKEASPLASTSVSSKEIGGKKNKQTTQKVQCLQLGVPRGHDPWTGFAAEAQKGFIPIHYCKAKQPHWARQDWGKEMLQGFAWEHNINQHLPALRHAANGLLYSEGTSFLFF